MPTPSTTKTPTKTSLYAAAQALNNAKDAVCHIEKKINKTTDIEEKLAAIDIKIFKDAFVATYVLANEIEKTRDTEAKSKANHAHTIASAIFHQFAEISATKHYIQIVNTTPSQLKSQIKNLKHLFEDISLEIDLFKDAVLQSKKSIKKIVKNDNKKTTTSTEEICSTIKTAENIASDIYKKSFTEKIDLILNTHLNQAKNPQEIEKEITTENNKKVDFLRIETRVFDHEEILDSIRNIPQTEENTETIKSQHSPWTIENQQPNDHNPSIEQFADNITLQEEYHYYSQETPQTEKNTETVSSQHNPRPIENQQPNNHNPSTEQFADNITLTGLKDDPYFFQ